MSKLVEKSLQQWPETHNSDRKLILTVWYLQDPDYEDNFVALLSEQNDKPGNN